MKKIILILAIFLCGSFCYATEVIVLHTGDVHGRIEPVDYKGQHDFGGLSRRYTFINQQRVQNKNVLLLNSGDVYQGSLGFAIDSGKFQAKEIAKIKYDAITIGNHEFDLTPRQFKRNIKLSKTQYLSANVHFKNKYLKQHIKPYIIKEFDGEKYLIIGVTTSSLNSLVKDGNFTVTSPIDEINNIINTVPHDKVIVLSHCGLDEDREIAKAIPQIDLILGGHNHYFFEIPETVNGVPIIQDGEFGIRVGIIKMNDKNESYTYKNLTSDIEKDKDIQNDVDKQLKKYSKLANHVLAKTNITILGEQTYIEHNQSNLGSLVLLSYRKAFPKEPYDIVLTNSGSIRINKNIEKQITLKDALEILPFKDNAVIVEIQGKYLKQVLEHGTQTGRRYIQIHSKIKNIEDDKTYRVITSSYLASGKDGFVAFNKGKIIKTNSIEQHFILLRTIRKLKVITEKSLEF